MGDTYRDYWFDRYIQAWLQSLPRCDVCHYALQGGVCINKRCGRPLKPLRSRRGFWGWVL